MSNIQWQRPPLYPKQEAAIFDPARFVCIEASTKSGKTHGCIVWLLEQAVLHGGPGKTFYWIAPVTQQADTAWRRFKLALQPLYEHIKIHEGIKVITLWNGSRLAFKSADNPDSLYSDDVYAVVVDEASRCKPETLPASISITTKTHGPVRYIGNVKGKSNFFYHISREAQKGKPEWSYHKITAYDAAEAGVLTYAAIEQAKNSGIPDYVFRELYLAEPSDLASNPFGLHNIAACVNLYRELKEANSLDPTPVTYGWDLGKNMDWTVGIGLNKDGHVTNIYRWQLEGWETTIQRIAQISGAYPTYIDSTGLGDPILDIIKSKGHDNVQGFKFSNQSKQQLIEGLVVGIQSQEMAIPPGILEAELQDFEYTVKPDRSGVEKVYYSAPSGFHDDCVMALALSNKARLDNFIIDPPYEIEVQFIC